MYVDSISLMLTNDCNLACAYCFQGERNKKRMPMKIANQSLDWLLSEEVSGPKKEIEITFFGGEPLLEYEAIKKIVPVARQKEKLNNKVINFGMTTNGTLFTNEIVEYWKDNNLGLLLSCDGIEEAHNMFRKNKSGRGSFKQVEKNIEKIRTIPKAKEVRMTVAPQTSKYMLEGIKYLCGFGFESIAVFNTEENEWSEKELLKHEEEFFNLAEYYVAAIENGKNLLINPIHNRIKSLISKKSQLEDNTCGAGRNYLGIDTDGTIYPCHRFVSSNNFQGGHPLGNVFDGIDQIKRMPFLRMKKGLLAGCDVECSKCSLAGKCSGGCMAANYESTGFCTCRPASSRFHELIWYDTARSIIDYFDKNPSEHFDKKYRNNKNDSEAKS